MRQVTKYTDAIKASVLSKALAPNAPREIDLAKEFNIPSPTVYSWMHDMKKKNSHKELIQKRPKDQSPSSKLQAVRIKRARQSKNKVPTVEHKE